MRPSLKHRWMLGVSLAATVFATVLVVQTESSAAEIPPSPMAMVLCMECDYECGIGEHAIDQVYLTELPNMYHRKNEGEEHECGYGDSCTTHHPEKCDSEDGGCGPLCLALGSPEETSQLWATLSSDDTEAIMRAVVAYRGELEFNSDRNAFQSVDCAGLVVLHVPLESEIADVVRYELEALDAQETAR